MDVALIAGAAGGPACRSAVQAAAGRRRVAVDRDRRRHRGPKPKRRPGPSRPAPRRPGDQPDRHRPGRDADPVGHPGGRGGNPTRRADGREAWPGWEDTAVPPGQLGRTAGVPQADGRPRPAGRLLRSLRRRLRAHPDRLRPDHRGRYRGLPPLHHRGRATWSRRTAVRCPASTGDGQARSELLPRMYSPAMIAAFAEFEGIWDPRDRMNPGAVVRPRRLDADVRVYVEGPRPAVRTHLAFSPTTTAAWRRPPAAASASGPACPAARPTRRWTR